MVFWACLNNGHELGFVELGKGLVRFKGSKGYLVGLNLVQKGVK